MSLEPKIKQAFDAVTAPEQLKWNTLAAIEARRVAVGEKVSKAEQAAGVGRGAQSQGNLQGQRRSRARATWWKYALPMAACFMLAAVGIIGLGSMNAANDAAEEQTAENQTSQMEQTTSAALTPLGQAVAYVGIDVNPSLELALNDQDAVITAEAQNADAERVLAGLDLAGLPYDEALAALFASEGMAPYLNGDAVVEISVTTDDQALAQALVAQSDHALAQLPCSGNSQCVDSATREAAHHAGMGVGKYCVASELVQIDPSYTLDDCSHMSVRQLHDAIDHRSRSTAATASAATQSQGQGYGQGMQSQGSGQGYAHHAESHGSGHH